MADKTVYESLVKEFIETIWNDRHLVDPDDEYYWESLIYGWVLARGLKPFQEPQECRDTGRDWTPEEEHAYSISANQFALDVYHHRT